jgi:REP element-mobilizing transposase RayT
MLFGSRGVRNHRTPAHDPARRPGSAHRYMGGIARENGILALAIGGAADHVHLLLSLPRTVSVAKAVQLLKSGSSKWLHENFPKLKSSEEQFKKFLAAHEIEE